MELTEDDFDHLLSSFSLSVPSQSCGFFRASNSLASSEPALGSCMYSQRWKSQRKIHISTSKLMIPRTNRCQWKRHQNAFVSRSGRVQAELRSAIVDQIELDVAAAAQ